MNLFSEPSIILKRNKTVFNKNKRGVLIWQK